jgi:outer membrane protein assembly factor BamB
VGSVNAACINFRPPPRPLPAEQAGAAPSERWSRNLGRTLTGPVAVADSVLYAGGWGRKVVAVALDSGGEVRWTKRLNGAVLGGVRLVDGRLYVATSRPEGQVLALEPATGKTIWKTKTDRVALPLALAGNAVVAHTSGGLLVALDATTGRPRWRRRLAAGRAAPRFLADGSILATTMDSVVRLDARSGAVLARAASPGSIVDDWVSSGDLLVAGSTDSALVALDPRSLEVRWRVAVDAPVEVSPAIVGDTAYAVTRIGTLYRLVLGAGGAVPSPERLAALRWPVTAPPVRVDDVLILGGADGTLRAVRLDGSQVWRVAIWRPIEIAPLVFPDGLLAIGGEGDLHRYDR